MSDSKRSDLEEYYFVESMNKGIVRSRFDSKVYFPPQSAPMKDYEEFATDSVAIVIYLGGVGSQACTAQSHAFIGYHFNRYRIGFVTPEYPFHGDGPSDPLFRQWPHVEKWLFEIVKHYKKSKLPVFLVGHSGGASLVQELLSESPDLVQGAVFMSPARLTPNLDHHFLKSPAHHPAPGTSGEAGKWFFGLDLKSGIFSQLKSITDKELKTEKPVLILAGDRDPMSTPVLLQEACRRYISGELQIYKNVGHQDLLAFDGDQDKRFIEDIVQFIEQEIDEPIESDELVHPAAIAQVRYWTERSNLFRLWSGLTPERLGHATHSEAWAQDLMKGWKKNRPAKPID